MSLKLAAAPDTASSPPTALFLFDTTHAALEAEEIIIDKGFWCDMVPRPPEAAVTLCGLAVEVRTDDRESVAELLSKADIYFETYQPDLPDGP